MSNRQLVADQIRHYRELAQIAAECARSSPVRASEYSKLSKQWLELADSLERDAAMRRRGMTSL
ncbi:MAG TPA: hypothetical protein VFW28_03310 [Micropepsaceae bacterium]|nr:hypothetical protein [Micropepsaceae bacterium]